VHSKDLTHLRENAKLYKGELLLMLFDSTFPDSMPVVGGQAHLEQTPSINIIPAWHNVVGIGYGAKVSDGQVDSEEEVVRVYVKTKKCKSELTRTEVIPNIVNGVPTDVIEVGQIVKQRPVQCGTSIGHRLTTAGTIGCVVSIDSDLNRRYILSNNHVLANENNSKIGDEILQPGPVDGGVSPIAHLYDFEPIDFQGINSFDAAIAKVVKNQDILPSIIKVGNPAGNPVEASLNLPVVKHGRTTGFTSGRILDISSDVKVNFEGGVALFENQLVVRTENGVFSAEGDSGSLIVSQGLLEPVALLFAGSGPLSWANPIGPILKRFKASIVVN
jgi:hypothetical protein